MIEILALTILILFSLAGFAAIFFTTFGTLIILVGSVLCALLTGFTLITFKTLLVLLALYLVGEVLEYVFIIIGAKKFGATNAAAAGAIAGGIAGAIIGVGFFGVGLVLGTFLGIFLGAFLVELFIQKDIIRSLKAGTGGVLGRIGLILAKVIIAIVMFTIILNSLVAGAGQ